MMLGHGLFQSGADGCIAGRTLGGLGEDFHRAFQTYLIVLQCICKHCHVFHYDGVTPYLTEKAKYFSMSDLSEYDYLAAPVMHSGICLAYAPLEFQHHRTCAVYHLQTEALRRKICFGRFPMCAYQNFGFLRKVLEILQSYGHETCTLEAVQFGLIMDNGAQ